MKHNFDEIIERRGTDSAKWDLATQDVLPMWVADMDFAAPPPVLAALQARVHHGVFGYGLASDRLVNAFLEWQSRRNAWNIDQDTVVVVPGVMPAVKSAIEEFTDPGDQVVVQPPVYFPFFSSVELAERQLVLNPLIMEGERYSMDLNGLEQRFREGARFLLLCSPHNPVGRVWSRHELSELAKLCSRYDVLVVSDEIHGDIVYPGARFTPFGSLEEETGVRTITCASPSKTFNIAGDSVGFTVLSDPQLRGRFKRRLERAGLHHHSVLDMVAARAAYRDGEEWLGQLLDYLQDNLRFMKTYLSEHLPDLKPLPVEGTYVQWLDFRRVMERLGIDDAELRRRLREDAGVWLSDGPLFGTGGHGFQRINFATPRTVLAEGLSRISRTLTSG
jgi:cystathionine beta-lyase